MDRTLLKTMFKELRKAYRPDGIAVSSSMIDVVDFAVWRIFDSFAGDLPWNDSLRRNAEVPELHVIYDHVAVQFSIVNL